MKLKNVQVNDKTNFFISRDCITEAYFEDIRKYPILSKEEEYDLIEQMNNSNNKQEKEDAKNKLILSNLRFVISIAKKFGTKETFMDLVSEGNLGLIKAIERFDNQKGCKLITYAVSWIIAYIKDYQITKQNTVVPKNARKLHNYVKNVTKEFMKNHERRPTQQEIADMMREKFDFSVSNLNDVELTHVISIDEKIVMTDKNEKNNTIENSEAYISRTSTNNINDQINTEHIKERVETLLSILNEREKEIIKRYYGIGCIPESYDTIAMNMELCDERCRQICINAIKKMKNYKHQINPY